MNYTFHFGVIWQDWPKLLDGVLATLYFASISMLIGLVIAIAGAATLRFGPRWARVPVKCYVELFRNTPLVVQLFFIYFGLPSLGVGLEAGTAAIIGLTLNFAAYCVEIIRSGTLAVPKGLLEAGYSLGLRKLQVFFLIVLRPALIVSFPALSSQIIVLLLATSVISIISADELTAIAGSIQSRTFRSFEIYIVILVIYLGLSSIFKVALRVFYDRFIAFEPQQYEA